MKKFYLTIILSIAFLFSQTSLTNENIATESKVAIYIPARIGSTRVSQKLLKKIDDKTVIERTYERAKFIQRANRICVVTNSQEIASLIGPDALFIDKEYVNGTERICDALGLSTTDPRRAKLFDLAAKSNDSRIPADIAKIVKENQGVPVLVRTVANRQLSDEKLKELAEYIEENY